MSLVPYPLILIILSVSTKTVTSQCTSKTAPSSLATLTQYELASAGQSTYGHFLVNGVATFTVGNETAKAIYELTAFGITNSTTDCTETCLTKVSAYYRIQGEDVSLIMLRPSDESLYPDYMNMGLAPFYCASVSGNCGASEPLYQYHSSEYDDYYADVKERSDMNGTYSVAMMGSPLCYLWISNTTTTTTTTTTETPVDNSTTTTTILPSDDLNITTTTDPSNTTTTTDPSNITTTTALDDDSNTTTTTVYPPDDSNITTTTDPSSNITTTTDPSDPSSNMTTTTDPSSNITTTTIPGMNNLRKSRQLVRAELETSRRGVGN